MLGVLHYCHIHVHNENTLIILILLCSNCVLVHTTIQKQCMNIIISFILCSFLVYPIMFICILISLSNDRVVSCIIMCVWVHYPAIIIHHPHVHVVLYHFTCRYHTVRYNMDICISFCLTLFIKKYLSHIALYMFMFYSIRNIDSTCTRPLDLIGDIYLYIIMLGCFLNICTHVTYTNQFIREKMSTLLPGTPFFFRDFHHPPFILAHTLGETGGPMSNFFRF